MPFASQTQIKLSQPTSSTAITISDSTDLSSTVTKGIFVSVPAGATTTLAFKLLNDSSAVSVVLTSPQFIPGRFARVMSTGTTLNSATVIGFGG